MISRQRNRRTNTGLKVVLSVIGVLVVLRLFGFSIINGMLGDSANAILESRSNLFSPLRNTLTYFKSKNDLEEQRKNLLAENTDLKLKILTSQAVNADFEHFNSRFGQFTADAKTFKVILKPPFMPFDKIRIAGELDSYTVGNLVFFGNVVIGTIAETTGRYATIELFSTPGKVTPASVKGTQFEAKGLGGGRYVMEVAKDFEIAEGDPITYPQEQLVLLGVVGQIESLEENLFKKIYFNTPAPLNSLSFVTIGIQSYEQTQPSS